MGMVADQHTGAARRGPADPQAAHRGPDLTPEQTALLRARQKSRNRAMLIALVALVALFFAIAVGRLSQMENPETWSRPGSLAPVPPAPGGTAPSR